LIHYAGFADAEKRPLIPSVSGMSLTQLQDLAGFPFSMILTVFKP
jgi:hypothetical protein